MSETPMETCETSVTGMGSVTGAASHSIRTRRRLRVAGVTPHTTPCHAGDMAPTIRPGEIAGWPLLSIVYRTDPDKIADLLPPGIEPGAHPHVHVNVYNFPVKGEP